MSARLTEAQRRMPACRRAALAELAASGTLYVVVANGEHCRHPATIGSGFITGDITGRLRASVGTVTFLLRSWVQWCQDRRAYVLRPESRAAARMIGDGRDVIALTGEDRK